MSTHNFYDILNSQPSASFDELKRNYKHLILQCHPDKLQSGPSPSSTAVKAGDNDGADPIADESDREFVTINEAWNTLKDPAKRKLYDAELLLTKFQTHSNIYERLKLSDMKRNTTTATAGGWEARDESGADGATAETTFYTYGCRCGGQYVVDESADNAIFSSSAPADDELIVECSECSLVINIQNG